MTLFVMTLKKELTHTYLNFEFENQQPLQSGCVQSNSEENAPSKDSCEYPTRFDGKICA